eukprot:6476087-Amphidinium_carterae.1
MDVCGFHIVLVWDLHPRLHCAASWLFWPRWVETSLSLRETGLSTSRTPDFSKDVPSCGFKESSVEVDHAKVTHIRFAYLLG